MVMKVCHVIASSHEQFIKRPDGDVANAASGESERIAGFPGSLAHLNFIHLYEL